MTGKSAKADAEEITETFEKRIAEAEEKAAENMDLAKRIQADFDNYKKRMQREN